MFDYKACVTKSGLALLPKAELKSLLKYKLQCLEQAKEQDLSLLEVNPDWNYGIDELKAEIASLED